ncbi:MAG: bifunctional diaminohydroxyphosphoribosylaminopyrimidine deaminase/5-amino-6-(5-phosphoribosylamino)uracil reductase RibD [Sphingobium sp.]
MQPNDMRFMHAAIALSDRGKGRTAPNPNVGCLIVRDGVIVGRGWTQPGGRPHAEARALQQAADLARGACAYVTLEPCFHFSPRGPRCVDLLVQSGVKRVVIAARDPDPRTDGQSITFLRAHGITVDTGVLEDEAKRQMAGFFLRQTRGRPFVTLKLGLSLDGCIAMADGSSRWITGPAARAHAHLERSRHEAILVGRGTWLADAPALDIRLAGLEQHAPQRFLLGHGEGAPAGWTRLSAPDDIAHIPNVAYIMVEGGAQTAAAFLRADLVDRLLFYRAPVLMGGGRPALGDIGLESLAQSHGRWRLSDNRMFGDDRMEVYLRKRAG